jgi:hypothetical protein
MQTGGTIGSTDELFAELQTVTVDNGYFSVLLGQGSSYTGPGTPTEPHGPLSGVFTTLNAPRYVEMTVVGIGLGGASVTILPRLQLVDAPYALLAVNAANVTGSNVITAANLSTNLGLWQANGPNIYFNSGNVGIGTPSPSPLGLLQAQGHNTVNLFAGDETPFGVTGLETWFSTPQTHIYCSEGPGNTNVFSVGAGGRAYFAGNVGIGTGNPVVPLTFPAYTGDKICLYYTSPTANYGFGIQGSLLQIHADVTGSDIAFGTGSSTNMNETMRIKGNGNVGIGTGTNNPTAKLDVRGDIRMQGGYNNYPVLAVGAFEDLQIVRGIVEPYAAVYSGTGFTVSSNAVGWYSVTFNTSFFTGNSPAVTVTPMPDIAGLVPLTPYTANVYNASDFAFEVRTYAGSTPANVGFSFTAIGAR